MEKQWSPRFRYFMLGMLVVSLVVFAWFIRDLFPPLIIAGLLAYVLNPIVNLLADHTRLSHDSATGIVFLLGLLLLAAIPVVLVPTLLGEIQTLSADFETILASVQVFISQPVVVLGYMINLEQFLPDLTELSSTGLAEITGDAFHLIETTTKNVLWLLVILVMIYYTLRDWSRFRDWMFSLAPEKYQDDFKRIFVEIKEVWRGYLRGNLALMGVVAILFTIAWLILGIPGALLLGIIAGVLTIIPDLGPAIAAILAVIVAFVEGSYYLNISNFWFAVLTFGVYLVLINIKNIWIRPRIFGRSVHMHDGLIFVVIIAAVVFTGILGAIVVVPVLASAGIIYHYIWKRILGEDPWPVPSSHLVADELVEEEVEGLESE